MIDPTTISWLLRIRATPAWKTSIWSDPATTDGDEVRSVGDVLSGETLAFNGGAGPFPTFRDDEGGFPALRFAGNNASLLATSLPLGDYTWFLVVRPSVLAGVAWSQRDSRSVRLAIEKRVTWRLDHQGRGVASGLGRVGTAGRHLIEGQYRALAGWSDLWIDGRRIGTLEDVTALTPDPNGTILGGRGVNVIDPWSGDLFEFAVVSAAITEQTRAGLRAWWMDQYGIPAGGATGGYRARRHIDAGDAG